MTDVVIVGKVTRLVPKQFKFVLDVVRTEKIDDMEIFFVTREEALRFDKAWHVADDVDYSSRARNYELEGNLRNWYNQGEKANFVINSWCPYNGAWCAWTRYMPLEEAKKLAEDPEVDESARQYIKAQRLGGLLQHQQERT